MFKFTEDNQGLNIVANACAAAAVGSTVLALLDDAILLTPEPDSIMPLVFVLAIVVGLSFAVAGWAATVPEIEEQYKSAKGLGALGFLAILTLGWLYSETIHERHYFDEARMVTRKGTLIPITEAWHRSGKWGGTSYVKLRSDWPDISIDNDDFRLMRRSRNPNDRDKTDYLISSYGWFCLRADLDESGSAKRLRNYRFFGLPEGSVVLCPREMVRSPYP